MIEPFYTGYSKITDTLMWFNDVFQLQFMVQLTKKNKKDPTGPPSFCHKEYVVSNQEGFGAAITVRRNFTICLKIHHTQSYDDGALVQIRHLVVLDQLFNKVIFPWFFGKSRIYDIVDNRLVITGTYKDIEVPLSERTFLAFSPIIIDYADGTSKEGIRMCINRYDNVCDMSIDKFMEFKYYISNVDYYTAATNLLTYLKTEPYGVNLTDLTNQGTNFFDQ